MRNAVGVVLVGLLVTGCGIRSTSIPDADCPQRDESAEGAPTVPEGIVFMAVEPAPPQVIYHTKPEYPEAARLAELEGVVMVRIQINADGSTSDPTVVQGIEGLNQAALDCVSEWLFEPAREANRPIPFHMVVPVRFSLRDE